jgi:hypothetical protein
MAKRDLGHLTEPTAMQGILPTTGIAAQPQLIVVPVSGRRGTPGPKHSVAFVIEYPPKDRFCKSASGQRVVQ